MSTQPYRLVYYSRNRIATDPAAAIREILEASRRNNTRVGVTGALMFNSGCFGQILEGPREAVEATFERIQRDARHGDVSLLDFKPVPARSFDEWSMAFVGVRKDDEARYGDLGRETGFDPSRMSSDTLFELLHGLTQSEEFGS
ncbi:BLUF domain-containing protein [Novosphingobium sp. PS1R-30]|uniref:BLUF domain-containing protein n=1 Tax=Novosphingobium anseongense TaxID=3133436 RepID=A0ABU8S1U0_9SPHN|nr:MAG: BLUF domain-containing protein [Rhizobiaceae bacterium]